MATLSASPDIGHGSKQKGQFDGWLLVGAALLMLVGLMSIYSEGYGRGNLYYFRQQILYAVIGLVPFIFLLTVPAKAWMRLSGVIYIVNNLGLMAVLLFGKSVKGAERWLQIGPLQFQPSEAAKLLLVLSLAGFFAMRQAEIKKFSTVALSLAHLALPMFLVLKQPHYGAAGILAAAWFTIALLAGVPGKFLGTIVATVVIFVGVNLTVPAVGKVFLKGYHLPRLLGFMGVEAPDNGKTDKELKKAKSDATYQTTQAAIAFGLGGVSGRGYLKGEQKESHFIPEQHNDFVFTVPGEEAGLIGCTLILALFSFFFYRVWLIVLYAVDPFYRMVAGGLFAVLVFHTFVNIGMVVSILPVIGLWLPFLSAGGTALWLCMASVGLLLNIRRQEAPILF